MPDQSLYFYKASLPAAAVFAVLNAIPAAFLFFTTIIGPKTGKYRNASFFIPLCIGGLMEVLAYIVRCISIKMDRVIALYAVSSSLIVVAPVLVCASLYLLVGRLVRAGLPSSGNQQRILGINPWWLPRIFVTSDILSFLTQASGSGIAASGNWEGSTKTTGENVLKGGLALQLITFTLFLALVARFHSRANAVAKGGIDSGVFKVLLGLYISGFFIEVRCVYRLIEFILGIDGYPFRHEWPLYVLEGLPMLFAMFALAYFHPGKLLPNESLNSETDTEEMQNRNGY
ncbi:TPA_exp: putative RTA1 domain protein [Trichophyton benhamiae CBS 112371]|uniref:RTA1 domain protein, putative n=1 Tax=Arthroderma benhamiae (strain ATCC MYA-4681 / CBS 112371) TaxID=663331 RepID=D4AR86_ARTBC|nr:RTA1 domain protein, putative [Trichophyton benhamiae CBS 112371]EFE34515.1 RTA1 domain protein, putative [Trichophyton benhamiae CBS 112371]DAA77454.1 TPA_exp: putative RTA1 domain protein [Trichophyton benhamiae CBS 112371]